MLLLLLEVLLPYQLLVLLLRPCLHTTEPRWLLCLLQLLPLLLSSCRHQLLLLLLRPSGCTLRLP